VTEEPDGLLHSVRARRDRRKRWLREGEPSLGRHLAQVGVLGWTGPLLMLGVVLGCWSAWKWMHGR
jgi:ATP synthase protein I